ncbi:MAG: cupin domain-containing protein [Eubacteriales bacterium]
MIETLYKMSRVNKRTVEKIILDENLHYIHVILNKDEGLPEHYSNSNIYMTVLMGELAIGLNEQEMHEYGSGNILKIPKDTKMNIKNLSMDILEFIIVKAPAPER